MGTIRGFTLLYNVLLTDRSIKLLLPSFEERQSNVGLPCLSVTDMHKIQPERHKSLRVKCVCNKVELSYRSDILLRSCECYIASLRKLGGVAIRQSTRR